MSAPQHIILYSTGVGDRTLDSRRRLFSFWRHKDVAVKIVPNNWQINEPAADKLSRLLAKIDKYYKEGKHVSIIGESAGASIATQALAQRGDKLTAVILLCGKSKQSEKIGSAYTNVNPALKEAVTASEAAIASFTEDQKAKVLNLHPFFDSIVPVAETKIAGVRDSTMPVIGHVPGIVFGLTVWSGRIVRFIKESR